MKEKEKLVVFLGAGASIHAGIPSTREITQWLIADKLSGTSSSQIVIDGLYEDRFTPAILPEQPVFSTIYHALRSKFKEPNFEHILAVLEDLSGLVLSQSNRPLAEDYVNVLAPFLWVEERYQILRNESFLRYARQHFLKIVMTNLQNKLVFNAQKHTEDFLNALQDKYSLAVFTLNYDEVIDRSLPDWYDGFSEPVGAPAHYEFNRQEFAKNIHLKDNLLCHLHGSVLYGYHREPSDSLSLHSLVKYDTVNQALEPLEWGLADRLVKGSAITTSPIISGLNKAAKLTYSTVPYSYYFKALTDTLISCPKMIVIGYGGYDDHINTWFDEFIAIHRERRRVVFVTPREGKDIGEYTGLTNMMQGFAGIPDSNNDVVHSYSAFFDEVRNPVEFHKLGTLALCAAGFPFKNFDSTMNSILDFLGS